MKVKPIINVRLLKAKMALSGYRRRDLAEKANVSIDTVNNVLGRKGSCPSYNVMISISKALNLTPPEATEIFFNDNLLNE